MQWRGAYGSNSKSCPPNTLPLLIGDFGSYSMTFKETLAKATAEVDKWPQWMREAMGVIKAMESNK